MKKIVFIACLTVVSLAAAQEQNQKVPIVNRYVRCGALIQPETGKVQRNVLITIQGERVKEVQENANANLSAPAGGQVQIIDLSDHT
jgi:hypothetical protein